MLHPYTVLQMDKNTETSHNKNYSRHASKESITEFLTVWWPFCLTVIQRYSTWCTAVQEVHLQALWKYVSWATFWTLPASHESDTRWPFGVVCHVDDVLVSGKDQEEHDSCFNAVLHAQRIQAAGLTLNRGKCQFSCYRIVFLGHVIDANGISPDPQKTEAIRKMKPPTELRRFMGMINQLNKFSPHIARLSQPLWELLKLNTTWMWTSNHDEAFCKLKDEVFSSRVLVHYDLNAATKIRAYASLHGLGAMLLQQQDNCEWKPVALASMTLKAIIHRLKRRH